MRLRLLRIIGARADDSAWPGQPNRTWKTTGHDMRDHQEWQQSEEGTGGTGGTVRNGHTPHTAQRDLSERNKLHISLRKVLQSYRGVCQGQQCLGNCVRNVNVN